MLAENENDYIRSYENALADLKATPRDQDIQHRAVLALARAGSLHLALAKYNQFGLDTVRHHEDIMALGGRLTKDLYLSSNGETALNFARDSAHKYEGAFKDTQGYYSGINAATMALMAQMPIETISDRAKAILDILPKSDNLPPADHYFIEATRAECHLLLDNLTQAQKSLESAISFDPLNYTAHATTLKQFKMILEKRGESIAWLSKFYPPTAMHYAGHINLGLSTTDQKRLKLSVADKIQQNDIGFGYGALAAGSDILIAEALLAEGGELHVILPSNQKEFLEHSVKPFGAQWVKRFKTCLTQASSIKIATERAPWPHPYINQLVGQFAMGKAILQSQKFSVAPCQLLIWDRSPKSSYTSVHAADWYRTDNTQIIIPLKPSRNQTMQMNEKASIISYVLKSSDETHSEYFESATDAFNAAKGLRAGKSELRLGLHVDIDGADSESELNSILEYGPPQSTLMSELFASILAYQTPENFNMNFAGLIRKDEQSYIRCYAANS